MRDGDEEGLTEGPGRNEEKEDKGGNLQMGT